MNHGDVFGIRKYVQEKGASEGSERSQYLQQYFSLTANPFPEIGVPESDVLELASIRDEQLAKIGEWLAERLSTEKQGVLIIKGQYGSGKSMLLRKIVSDISEAFPDQGEPRPKVIYVYRPSVEAQALNRAILEEIGLDNVRKMVWNIVGRELANDISEDSERLRELRLTLTGQGSTKSFGTTGLFTPDQIAPTVQPVFNIDDATLGDYRLFLQRFDKLKHKRAVLIGYFTDLLSRGLDNMTSVSSARAFVSLLLAYDDSEAWQSLLNVRVPRRDQAGFVKQFLQDLIVLLRSDNYTYLFVAIDEFEQITDRRLLSPKQQAEYAYTMMEIINQIDTGLGLIISITEEGFQNISEIAPLKDRLYGDVELGPLNEGETKELVGFYLSQARSTEGAKSDSLYPFTQENIDFIVEKIRPIGLGTTPRNIVQFFHQFIEFCVSNKITSIDSELLGTFVEHYRRGKGA